MHNLSQTWEKEKKLCLFSLAATFLWGLFAHGYGIMDSNFTHDSLDEFYGSIYGTHVKISVGRFFVPFYRYFSRTALTLPWLIGILGLLWCGLAVYLVIRLFQIEHKGFILLTAGIFTVNLTVSSTIATFIHDFDSDMLSLMFSVAAAFCWRKHPWGWLPGALLLVLSLALYQSYISVTIVLVMIVCILDLLDEIPFRKVFTSGLKAVAMLLLGGIVYYIAMKAALKYTGVTMLTGQYNTLDKSLSLLSLSPFDLKYLFKYTYVAWYEKLVNVISPYPAITALATKLLLLFIGGCVCLGLLNRKVGIPEKLLGLTLLLLLPFAMNIMYFLTLEQSHELMRFAFWLTHFFALLLCRWLSGYLKNVKIPSIAAVLGKIANVPGIICAVLVVILVHGSVQTANAMYLKKDLEHDAYMAVVNRIVYRMESYDGYEPGTTPVVIAGLPAQMNEIVPGFETYRDPNGMYLSDALCFPTKVRWQRYFSYMMMNPVLLAEDSIWGALAESSQVAAMPVYPDAGCIEMIDGVLVVKVG